jgi:hypothetical protein
VEGIEMTTILWGYVIPESPKLPEPEDFFCEDCGFPMRYTYDQCADVNCDCQRRPAAVHVDNGSVDCNGEEL